MYRYGSCATHVDSRYVSMILQYLKEFCVAIRSLVTYASVDDKAIIPVGEPGLPVSTGVRGHNRCIVLAEGPGPSALDHDFHVQRFPKLIISCSHFSQILPTCYYCLGFPVRMPKMEFQKLSFVPLSLIAEGGQVCRVQ